jgi:uncharacterized protein (DUF1330 family)
MRMAAEQRHVQIYGLNVIDDEQYARYRAAMAPMLREHGGSFGYDFVVSKVLKSESDAAINRVFSIAFPDQASATRFFADPAYLQVRARLFSGSVAAVTKIAGFDEPEPAATP